MNFKNKNFTNMISLALFLVVLIIFGVNFKANRDIASKIIETKKEMAEKMESLKQKQDSSGILDNFYNDSNINIENILNADDNEMKEKLVALLKDYRSKPVVKELMGDERREMVKLLDDTLIMGDSQVAHIKYSGALEDKYLAYMPGKTLVEQLDYIDDYLKDHKDAKNVILWNGFNIFNFKDVNEFLAAYKDVYDKVDKFYDGKAKIYVCSLLPARDDALYSDLKNSVRHDMYKGPEYDYALREFFGDKYLNINFLVRDDFYTTDGVHFGPYFNFTLIPYLAYYTNLSYSNDIKSEVSLEDEMWKVATNSVITIGNFYDLQKKNLVEAPLKFKVIENDGRDITCISYEIIDNIPYAKEKKCEYKDSYLRKYLNEYIYNSCFTDKEKKFLKVVYKENGIKDYVTALGLSDYRKYVDLGINFTTDNSKYAHNKIDKNDNSYVSLTGNVWLRDSYYVAYNYTKEYKVLHLSSPYDKFSYGVRPVIKIGINDYLKYSQSEKDEPKEKEDYDSFYLSYFENEDISKDSYRKLKDYEKTVMLTFDDGPSERTNEVLDILDEHGVKATFFLCDYGYNDKERIKRIIDSGHSIGIHCFSHHYDELYTSVDTYLENIGTLKEKLKNDFHIDPKIIRFPGGSSNENSLSYERGIMTKLSRIMHEDGYEFFDWNITSGDANPLLSSKDVLANVMKGLNPFRENIILLHDSSEHKNTVEALPYILEYVEKEGYKIDVIKKDTLPIYRYIVN